MFFMTYMQKYIAFCSLMAFCGSIFVVDKFIK